MRVCTPPLKRICTVLDFAIDALNCAYPGCTGMYLGEAGHMLAFYGRKTNPKAGLIHDHAMVASKAIINIPTWMGYFARWRVKCVSISEASEIVVGCKRLEKENWRRARWDLQKQFSAMPAPPDHFSLRSLHSHQMKMMATCLPSQEWMVRESSHTRPCA